MKINKKYHIRRKGKGKRKIRRNPAKNWKKVEDKNIGNRDISIIYKKNNLSLELFRDSMWGKTDNMNVIIRDKNKKSAESSLGKTKLVKYFETKSSALKFAKAYMEKHK